MALTPKTPRPGVALMRVVFDTNVLISAALTPGGTCAQLFASVREGLITPVVDSSVVAEYRAVIARPHFHAVVEVGDEFIETLLNVAEWFESTLSAPLLSDPGDQCFADLAVTARADAIVTGNTRHFMGLDVVARPKVYAPGDLLSEVRRLRSE